jgi:hypothetical protein
MLCWSRIFWAYSARVGVEAGGSVEVVGEPDEDVEDVADEVVREEVIDELSEDGKVEENVVKVEADSVSALVCTVVVSGKVSDATVVELLLSMGQGSEFGDRVGSSKSRSEDWVIEEGISGVAGAVTVAIYWVSVRIPG